MFKMYIFFLCMSVNQINVSTAGINENYPVVA